MTSVYIALYRRERVSKVDTALVFLPPDARPIDYIPRGFQFVAIVRCETDVAVLPFGVVHTGGKEKREQPQS